jgi:type II secretory pathway pseudopilin PulG
MSEYRLRSRRQFLKGTLLGISAAAMPALLAACGGGTTVAPTAAPGGAPAASAPTIAPAVEPTPAPAATGGEIKILTSGWPLTPMPTADEINSDPGKQGYGEALQTWLDQNPGVTFEQVEVDIWNQETIVTAISGGTAPTYVFANAIGGWSLAGARAAFVQGLVADLSSMIEKYGLKTKLTDLVRPGWERASNVEGKYYNYPIDGGVDGVLWYRRDLIKERGLKEPTLEWTWDDLRALAKGLTSEQDKRRGFGAQNWMAGYILGFHGFDNLSNSPTPGTAWNWSRDFSDPRWAEILQQWRTMVFEDQSVYTDVALGDSDDEYQKAFINGSAAIVRVNPLAAFQSSANEAAPAALAKRLNKPFEELVGFVGLPRGDGYFQGGIGADAGVSVSPDTPPEVIDKAIGAVDYMFLSKGWDIQKAGQYEATKDLQAVFNYYLPIDGRYEYEGVPGTFADAWGQSTLDALLAIGKLPNEPDPAFYFPAERNSSPDDSAITDAWSTITYVADNVDVAAELKKAQDIWNTQADSLASSISDADFLTGAQAYFKDLDAFFAQNMPEFHQKRFKPWYESKVLPALQG